MLSTILCLLFVGIGQMWAGTYTVYASGDLFGEEWSSTQSTIYIGFNYNPNNQWASPYEMTKTSYTYKGKPIYSAEITSSTNTAKIFFYHYKNGSNVASYQASDGSDWVDLANVPGYMYLGYISSGHRWATYCRDATIYFLKNGKTSDWSTLKVHGWNVGYDAITTTWPGIAMSNTGKTYGGVAIYSVTLNNPPYSRVIFNQGNSYYQSGQKDLAGNEGKIFDYENDRWLDYHYDQVVTVSSTEASSENLAPLKSIVPFFA